MLFRVKVFWKKEFSGLGRVLGAKRWGLCRQILKRELNAMRPRTEYSEAGAAEGSPAAGIMKKFRLPQ